MASVTVRPDDVRGEVSPLIYGLLTEHIADVVYGVAPSERTDDDLHRHARTLDHGLAAHNLRVDGDSVLPAHSSHILSHRRDGGLSGGAGLPYTERAAASEVTGWAGG